MKRRLVMLVAGVILALPHLAGAQAPASDQDETREFFIESRTRATAQPKRGPSRSKKRAPAKKAGAPQAASTTGAPEVELQPGFVGLGYTLFKEVVGSEPVRVAPYQVFKVGDRVRLQCEPNIDGYLYVFYTENSRNPVMLYPDARLAAGTNSVAAHTLVEVPARNDPKYQWLKITGAAAVDRVFIVVTREPLPGVPSGTELVRYCDAYKAACPWKPSDTTWGGIVELARESSVVSVARDAGTRQTQAETKAVAGTRELELSSNDAEPSVVAVAASDRSVLVSTVDIKHE